MKTRIVGRGICIHKDKVLLVRQRLTGVWVVPGGGWCHATDETVVECIEREFVEEVGLIISVDTPFCFEDYQKDGEYFIVLFYLVALKDADQEVVVSDVEDVAEARWVSREDLPSMGVVWPKGLLRAF